MTKKKVTLYLPEEVVKKMKHKAIDSNKNTSEYVSDLIESDCKK